MTKNNKETKQAVNNVDSLWDGWLDGIKQLNDMQSEFEKKSFKTLKSLEKLVSPTGDVMKQLEDESVKLTKDMNKNFQDTINATNSQLDSTTTDWLNNVEKVNDYTQNLLWRSNNTMIDFFTKSQDQISTNIESALDQQQKSRTEIVNTIEGIVEKIKEAQKTVTPTK